MTVNVIKFDENTFKVAYQHKVEQALAMRALKIVALATIILPLLCSLGAILYHRLNPIRFEACQVSQNTLAHLLQTKNVQELKVFLKSPLADSLETKELMEGLHCAIELENPQKLFEALWSHKKLQSLEDAQFKELRDHIVEKGSGADTRALPWAAVVFALVYDRQVASWDPSEDCYQSALREVFNLYPSIVIQLLKMKGFIASHLNQETILAHISSHMATQSNQDIEFEFGKEYVDLLMETLARLDDNDGSNPDHIQAYLERICHQVVIFEGSALETHKVLLALRESRYHEQVIDFEAEAREIFQSEYVDEGHEALDRERVMHFDAETRGSYQGEAVEGDKTIRRDSWGSSGGGLALFAHVVSTTVIEEA